MAGSLAVMYDLNNNGAPTLDVDCAGLFLTMLVTVLSS